MTHDFPRLLVVSVVWALMDVGALGPLTGFCVSYASIKLRRD